LTIVTPTSRRRSGLVAITPAAGFVQPASAVAIGFVGAVGCNFATRIKFLIRVDEALDVFATHAIGGVIGNCMTGLLAQQSVASLDGFSSGAGWIDQ
jgi:Amt family ammonium transporter